MKSYRADEHYTIHRNSHSDITHITCNLCEKFAVHKNEPGMKRHSGDLGFYNRMRAKMVRHLGESHPGSATERDVAKYGEAP